MSNCEAVAGCLLSEGYDMSNYGVDAGCSLSEGYESVSAVSWDAGGGVFAGMLGHAVPRERSGDIHQESMLCRGCKQDITSFVGTVSCSCD